jgi:hypothetical protein
MRKWRTVLMLLGTIGMLIALGALDVWAMREHDRQVIERAKSEIREGR